MGIQFFDPQPLVGAVAVCRPEALGGPVLRVYAPPEPYPWVLSQLAEEGMLDYPVRFDYALKTLDNPFSFM